MRKNVRIAKKMIPGVIIHRANWGEYTSENVPKSNAIGTVQ
jgi:hypothetical protein